MEATEARFAAARRLSAALVGETLEVRAVLFGLLRRECERLGVVEGVRLVVQEDTTTHLYLARADGGIVMLKREWGQFIQVEPVTA
jgi:hypothetical protein